MVKIDLIVIGNAGTGKTSLAECYKDIPDQQQDDQNMNNQQEEQKKNFKNQYMPTVGINLVKKNIKIGDQQITLCIWDTAGQEQYFSLTRQFFEKADGVVLVFDITDKESFKKVQDYWIEQVKDRSDEDVKKILVGNKVDMQDNRQVKFVEAQELADLYDMKYFETSAQSEEYVKDSFDYLAKICLKSIQSDQVDEPPLIHLQDNNSNNNKQTGMDKVKSIFKSCFS